MNALRAAAAFLVLALAGGVAAQTGDGDSRGSAPPGTAQDGSRPGEGAITGGSIAPGESGGVPDGRRGATDRERANRCQELSGTLREDCLLKEQQAGSGATRAPDGTTGGIGVERGPRAGPPPQNPR